MTLVELIVSLSITAIVLIIIVVFISDGTQNITRSLTQTQITDEVILLNEVLQKLDQSWYSEFQMLYDAPVWAGMDIFMLTRPDESDGYIWSVVDTRDYTAAGIYDDYYTRVLGYRRLSASEIAALNIDVTPMYDYEFFLDKTFPHLVTRNLQIQTYNTGSIVEMSLWVLDGDSDNYEVSDWSDISEGDIFSFNIIL